MSLSIYYRLHSYAAPTFSRWLLFLCCVVFACPASAIVIRHDKADSRYRVEEADYLPLFFLHTRFNNKLCVATLISDSWAITAAHCVDQTPLRQSLESGEEYPVEIDRRPFRVVQMVVHPLYSEQYQEDTVDLALLRLDRAVTDVQPLSLNNTEDESGRVVTLLGWGFTGIGSLGRSNNDGHLRRAENRISAAGRWIYIYFDDPRVQAEDALPLEGMPGLGDSGGPALLVNNGQLVIAGIALGEIENPQRPMDQGLYGSTAVYERISSHLQWINQVIAGRPN